MLYGDQWCCESLERSISRGEIVYEPVFASVQYYIKSAWNEPGVYYRKNANFCPYCGAKLHQYLIHEYRDELEKALDKEYCDITPDEIPEEFKSDEWWRKRGL